MKTMDYGKKVMANERRRVAYMSRQECLDKIFGKSTTEAAARAAEVIEKENRPSYAAKVAATNFVKAELVFGINVDADGDRFHKKMITRHGVIDIEGTVLIHGSAIVDRIYLDGHEVGRMVGNIRVSKLSELVYAIRSR